MEMTRIPEDLIWAVVALDDTLPDTADRQEVERLLDAAVVSTRTVCYDDDPEEVERLYVVLSSGHELDLGGPEGGDSFVRFAGSSRPVDYDWAEIGFYYWSKFVDGATVD